MNLFMHLILSSEAFSGGLTKFDFHEAFGFELSNPASWEVFPWLISRLKHSLSSPIPSTVSIECCIGRTCWQGSWGACRVERRDLGLGTASLPLVQPRGPHLPNLSQRPAFPAQSRQPPSRGGPCGEALSYCRHYRRAMEQGSRRPTAKLLVRFPQPDGH